ncbi:hypothetical protein [Actinacidiphila paucisporea]|uniref:Uncharacterized protein n=1 Tax=Actinacidiphila paucisporea TaxID=310782 RepID=A0A1M6YNF3_9ACTN|nr:hypothetical protein [Actinacidiphila paucisporea]SHL19778.1 hypothetical protein SAMN05216499_10357 [Actinacidiphila paucisporea]
MSWGEPTGPIDITPSDLDAAATTFAGGQTRLDGIADTLGSALRAAAGMAGDDKYGKQFAKSYDPAARALFTVLSASVRAVGQSATGLVRTANNYLTADHHSNPKAGKSTLKLFGWPAVVDDVMYPDPPSAIGGGSNHWPPPIDKYWANGHQDRLRSAAAAFRTAAGDINGLGVSLHLQVQAITDVNTSGAVTAMAAFWARIWHEGDPGGLAPLSTAHLACTQLASVCEKFAASIDKAHSEFEHKVTEAGLAIGITTALGVLGTVVTLGGSDAGAAALDAGEAAVLFASVDGILDTAMADLAAEDIGELETVLASAAEGVPEVEAVDAETTEVTQALDREMAEAEARGGGKPPPEEPGEEPPGRGAQRRGKEYEDHLHEKLDGEGNFKEGGREFDGTLREGDRESWYEAKSGRYWELAERDPKVLAKFKSSLGDARRIAQANGKNFLLISENDIPQSIIEWLTKKGFSWRIIPME